jgi:hypothetical protein
VCRFPLIALIAIGALGAAAVPTSAAKIPDACKLLKRSEIAKVFRADVDKPTRNTGLCAWDVDGGLGEKGGGSVTVQMSKGPDAPTDYERFSTDRKPVEGLGDRAFYDNLFGINVLKGDTYFEIQATYGLLGRGQPSDSLVKKRLLKLARIALRRA